MRIDPDCYGSDSLGNMLGSMTGPLVSGASATPITPTSEGRLDVAWSARRPVIVVSLVKSLDNVAVTISAIRDPDGAAVAIPSSTFAPYSEAGSALPLYAPTLGAGATSLPPFALAIETVQQPQTGPAQTLTPDEMPTWIAFEVIEGNMGKLLFLLGQEKARIRREGRQLAAVKLLSTARLDALDRIGADLAVPRFQDDLVYDASHNEVKTVILTDQAGHATLESDNDYARRLGIYRRFLLSSPPRALDTLNGSGKAGDPNAGLIAGLGLTTRFEIVEDDNPFAIALRIIGIGSETPRDNFLAYVRSDILTWLPDTPEANSVHSARYLPTVQQAKISALRARLQGFYSYPDQAAVAPVLADALDRLGRVLNALGHTSKLTINRAQDSTAGSRYELGLGVDIAALPAADLDTLMAAVNNSARKVTADQEAESLIAAARAGPPASAAADPDGSWLLTACGFRTVHRVDAATLYISHLPILGLVVDGPTTVATGSLSDYDAHFYPAEDPAINAALFTGLRSAATAWTAAGQTAWTQLTPAEQTTAWNQVITQAANTPAMETFAAAGLPVFHDPTTLMTALRNVPADMLATVSLDTGLASAIVNGEPAAITRLQTLVGMLKNAGLSSAVPLVTNAKAVLVVISVLGLPQIGVNLADRRASGFRWYTVSLGGQGSAKGFGSSTDLRAGTSGALALVCLGYVRSGVADPYEVVIGLPKAATLTLKEYEFLMNILERLYPIGIQINTYQLRQNHVDLSGDGHAEPLTASVARTYRSFRRPRLRGIYE